MFQFKEKGRNIKNMNEVEDRSVKWFWYPYIPFGRVTVVHGKKGCGKSMFAAKLMSACTNRKYPEDMQEITPGNVLYFSADDDLSDLVKPRLIQAGAELSRVYAVNDMLPVTLGDESLEQLVENYDIRMIILDPVQEYLEHDVYKDTRDMTYPILYKLERLAKERGCAVVLTACSGRSGKTNLRRRSAA